MAKARLRDLGINLGQMGPGPLNAITDVAGIKVGFSTLIRDEPHVIRSGVTAIWPADDIYTDFMFAGMHSFNGNGEMTGSHWINEQGLICAPMTITNTHAAGIARDAICVHAARKGVDQAWHLPVAAETWDGWMSDAETFPITLDMAMDALDSAKGGAVAEGNIGGGTGMLTHEFKGGTGTASRRLSAEDGGWTVGALVQSNYGKRPLLRCGHAPVGLELTTDVVASAHAERKEEQGSIIVILATDAPLLPIQCQRLARRATTGLAWVGGIGANGSGDIFLAFSTSNRVTLRSKIANVQMLGMEECTPLFQAAAEATEEAIWNALCAADTMTGYKGRIAHAIPHDLLKQAVARYARRD
jgi:D-aminopeptidase